MVLGLISNSIISLSYDVFLLCLLQVKKTYSNGTYRAGAMRQISLVGAVDEEVGDYFPEFLSMLEESPFLKVSQDRMNGNNAKHNVCKVNGEVTD